MAVTGEFVHTATLVDGETVTIRRLKPDDYDAVVYLAIDLSDQERYSGSSLSIRPTSVSGLSH